MNRQDLGNLLASQLISCMSDRRYGHSSSMDSKYSHLNDEGLKMMSELITLLAPVADGIRKEEIKNSAEDLMMAKLKD